MKLFNKLHLKSNRDKCAQNIVNSRFIKYLSQDVLTRLELIDLEFIDILIIGAHGPFMPELLKKKYPNSQITVTNSSKNILDRIDSTFQKINIDEDDISLDITQKRFDLIVFLVDLHWVNNIPKFLSDIRNILTQKGLFLGNFIGGPSLWNLRSKLISIEEILKDKHSSRVPPFIHFDDVHNLFSKANFKEIIIDYEKIELEYSNLLKLMYEIKSIGQSNIANNKTHYSISKKMLKILQCENDVFHDYVYLVSYIASPTQGLCLIK
ncbi:MAG: methyltransferase domain-containing protein [Rickettsiaceae bacterium]